MKHSWFDGCDKNAKKSAVEFCCKREGGFWNFFRSFKFVADLTKKNKKFKLTFRDR